MEEIRRLKFLGEAVARGERISSLAGLPTGELAKMYPRAGSRSGDAQPVGEAEGGTADRAGLAGLRRSIAVDQLVDALYDQVASSLAKGLGAEYASLYEVAPSGRRLIRRAQFGLDGLNRTIPLDPAALPGYAFTINETVIMSDRELERRFDLSEGLRDLPIRSAIAVPFGVHGRYGVIVAHSKNPKYFAAEDADFIESVATMLTSMAESAQSYSDVRRAQSLLGDIVQTIEVPFMAVDGAGRVTHSNQTFVKLTQAESLVGQSAFERVPHLQNARHRATFQRILRSGKAGSYEVFSEVLKRWYDVRLYPVSGGFAVYLHDVTLRKNREFVLERGGGLFRSLLRQIPGALWTTDRELHVVTMTGRLAEALGVPKSTLIGKPLVEIFPGDSAPILAAHRKAIAGESAFVKAKPFTEELRVFVEPIFDAFQQPVGTAGFAIAVG